MRPLKSNEKVDNFLTLIPVLVVKETCNSSIMLSIGLSYGPWVVVEPLLEKHWHVCYLFFNLFAVYFRTMSVTWIIFGRLFGWQWIMNWKRCGRKESLPILRNYADKFLKGPKKYAISPTQRSRCPVSNYGIYKDRSFADWAILVGTGVQYDRNFSHSSVLNYF
jgi:hypothetical protein